MREKKIDKSYLLIIYTIFFILGMAFIYSINFFPTNVTIGINFSEKMEAKKLKFQVETNDKNSQKEKVTVANRQGLFSLDPKVYKMRTLSFQSEEEIPKNTFIEGLTVYNGFSDKEVRVGNINAKKLYQYLKVKNGEIKLKNNKIELVNLNEKSQIYFTHEGAQYISKLIQKKTVAKFYLYFILIVIYSFLLLRLSFLKNISKLNFVVFLTSFFFISIFIMNILGRVDSNSGTNFSSSINENTEMVDLSDSITQQKFIVNEKNFTSIALFLKTDNSIDELKEQDISDFAVVYLKDAQTNKRIATKIITIDDIEGGQSVEIDFPNQKKSKNKKYLLEIQPSNNLKKGQISLAVNDVDAVSKDEQLKINGDKKNKQLVFSSGFEEYPYKKIVIILTVLLVVLILLACYYKMLHINPKILIILTYCLFFCYSAFRIDFYHEYIGETPDESSHISYVSYLVENKGKLVPNFENMKMRTIKNQNEIELNANDRTNYLGHPPLYYQILYRLGTIQKVKGIQYINWQRMDLITVTIGLIGILIIFYIGFTRIKNVPLFHLLYACITTSVPMMMYSISGVTNDTLALLTVSLFFLGLLRFSEKKYTFLTYLILSIGISGSLLTKLTAGLMVVLASIIYILYFLLKNKTLKPFFNWKFLLSVPLYLLPVTYFLKIYFKYKTFQPAYQVVAPEQFYQSIFYTAFENRKFMSIYEYVFYYFGNFFKSWRSLESSVSAPKISSWYSVDSFGIMAICFLPVLIFFLKDSKRELAVLKGTLLAIFLTFMMQFKNAITRFFQDGYLGSFQSRYYICAIAMMGLSIVKIFEHAKRSQNDTENMLLEEKNYFKINKKVVINTFIILLILSMFYGDFIYFLLNFTDY